MLHYFLFFLLTIFSLIFLFSRHKKHERRHHHLPPGPKGLPIIGNIHQYDPSAPHLFLSKLAKIYGEILFLRFGCRSVVVVQSASTAQEVLKTQDLNFCTRPSMQAQQRLSYNGLDIAFVPYNEYFREIRKICVVHLLSSNKVRSASSIRCQEVSRMIQNISSSVSETVNLSDLLMTLTSSIICRVAFGKRYKGAEMSKFHRLLNETQGMFTAFFFSDYFPYIGGWLDKLTGLSSKLERVFKEMDEFYDDVISDHLDPKHLKDNDYEDLVDVLLQLRKDRCFSFDLTLDNIKAILMNVIVAGTDTSAAMVVWTMTELMKNPKIMQKLQHELRTTIVQNKTFVNEDDIPKLTYLKAVIKETLRYHPAAPLLIVREAIQDSKIQGYDVPANTLVFVNVWEIARDPSAWTDPHVFMPERFLEGSIDFKGQHFEFIPFGAGRRLCPGMLSGLANLELALANLLYCFDWELPEGMKKEDIDTDMIPGITMHKKNPLCLVAKNKYSNII